MDSMRNHIQELKDRHRKEMEQIRVEMEEQKRSIPDLVFNSPRIKEYISLAEFRNLSQELATKQ